MKKKVKCDYCGKDFFRAESELKRCKHHFCCPEHYWLWMRKKVKVKCHWCGKEIEVRPSRLKYYEHVFCSKKCNILWIASLRKNGKIPKGGFQGLIRERLKPASVKKLSLKDRAYIAGLMDGEGCITVAFDKDAVNIVPMVLIGLCDKNVLQWIRDKVGTGSIRKKKGKRIRKPVYIYGKFIGCLIKKSS